jgi:phage terminase small subunit
VEKINIADELRRDNAANPRATGTRLALITDAIEVYAEASANVIANGAIVSHPRTGAPMENPYLAIMQKQAKVIAAQKGVWIDRVMGLLRAGR